MEKKNRKKGRGAAMVEYIIVVALIAILCIGAVKYLGSTVFNLFVKSADKIQTEFTEVLPEADAKKK